MQFQINTIYNKPLAVCGYMTYLTHGMQKSDRHEISPYNTNALENRVVMRIEYMIREDESN